MRAPKRSMATTPTPETPEAATDTLRPRFTVFPCEWCARTVGCPCVTGEIEVHRARAAATRQHRAAVTRARVSRRPARRAA